MNEEPVAIITGAGRGIGRATAAELSRRGHAVVLVARNEVELAEATHDCRVAISVRADVTVEADVARIVATALDRFGRIDALINNAGYAPLLTIEQTTAQEWHKVIDTNLSAAVMLCRACWPTFVTQQRGAIVNVSSIAARDPFPGFAAYGAAKAGLNTLGLALAREGAAHGIRVHTVAPGAVETQMFRALVGEDWAKDKTLPPAEVARVIVACVDGTLQSTSGEVIYVRRQPA